MSEKVLINHRYSDDDFLGRGGFSKVMKCYDHLTKSYVALKVIKEGSDDIREVEIMRMLTNSKDSRSRIGIKYYDSFTYNHRDYVVLELAGCNLHEFFYSNREIPYSIDFIRKIAKQLLEFLSYLHSCGVIHCDIKPENILLADDHYVVENINGLNCSNPHSFQHTRIPYRSDIKVIDFGLATFGDNRKHYSVLGTRPYRSPEMLLSVGWSYATDVWSVGCTLAEMYIGHQIFNARTKREQLLKIEILLGKFPTTLNKDSHYFSKAGYVICDPHRDFEAMPLHRQINHEKHDLFLDFSLRHPFLTYYD
ncbi:Dual specificity protein kinase CLK1 [Entamoeba marina]